MNDNDLNQISLWNDDELIETESLVAHGKRRKGWLKNIVAVLLGMVAGFILRIIILTPILIFIFPEDGIPSDLEVVIEIFTAFVAGALSGSLVPRLGWLFGALTQILKIILTLLLIGGYIYVVASDPEVDLSFALIKMPQIRIALFAIISATIAGAISEKHREKILFFLGSTFSFVGSSIGCLVYAIGGLFYLYVLYRAGKAFFEEGAILKAMLIAFIIGPAISYGGGALLMGIVGLGFWIFKKVYNWYALDLGLDLLD